MKYKIKVTTGFGADEKFTIEAEEAHKAYYLFNNPDARGTFKNGVAVVGSKIQGIMPDWNAIMGWNPTHKLTDEDWNEIRSKGVDIKMNNIIAFARDTAKLAEQSPLILEQSLTEIKLLQTKSENPLDDGIKELADKFKVL